MEFTIASDELRKALSDIDEAERNGFDYCLAVFRISAAGPSISDCRASYSDLCERAHPTDGNFNWGRFQAVTKQNRFEDGILIPLENNR